MHLDTDFGGDIDDICALALLLNSPEAEISGITTVAENDGKRAGQVLYTLKTAGRKNIPVKAGADSSDGYYPAKLGLPNESRYWPEPIVPLANSVNDALELLKHSVSRGAIIIAIGPLTNLYLLDLKYPGILRETEIFFMGGYIYPPQDGFPEWENAFDFNKQIDIRSSRYVLMNSNITLVQLSVTGETFLRYSDLKILDSSGSLGKLLARQAREFAKDQNLAQQYRDCANIPGDIINFQYDPLTAAIALGWQGAEIKKIPLVIEEENGNLWEKIDDSGKIFNVVTKVDGNKFNKFWLDRVTSRAKI